MISIMPGDGGFNGSTHMGKPDRNGYNLWKILELNGASNRNIM